MVIKKKQKYITFYYKEHQLVLNATIEDPIAGTKIQFINLSKHIGTRATFKHMALDKSYRKDPKMITKFVFQSNLEEETTFIKFNRYRKNRRISEGVDFYLSPVTPLEACVIMERTRKMLTKL